MYIDNWQLAIEKSWRVGLGHDFSADGADMMMDMAVRIFTRKIIESIDRWTGGIVIKKCGKKKKKKT